jgi:hypothetical protein
LGENKFLTTFLQAVGKRKALEERPWVFSNELLVLSELDDSKAIDEIEFNFIPIWIRFQKLPIRLMNKEVGELLGNEVGECLEVDVGDGDVMIGSFLRVKIRLDIRKPLMRGVTVQVGAAGVEKWCPIIYEFLPDFCYICGLIGHSDKACSIQLKKGEKRQFGGRCDGCHHVLLQIKRGREDGNRDVACLTVRTLQAMGGVASGAIKCLVAMWIPGRRREWRRVRR